MILGNGVEVLGIVFAFYLMTAATDLKNPLAMFVVYFLSWGCLLFFPHCLAHYIVGRLGGIRFNHYTLGKSTITKLRIPVVGKIASALPVLTLRIDRRSLGSASRGARAAMFASGATVSMILPFIAVIASFKHLPLLLSLLLLLISISNLGLDLYYSGKVGDLRKVRSH